MKHGLDSRANGLHHWIGMLTLLVSTWMLTSGNLAYGQASFVNTEKTLVRDGLAAPTSVAVDGVGNLFIADRDNNRVVMAKPTDTGYGGVTTLVSGLAHPLGVASDWSGNVYIADTGNNRLVILPVSNAGYGAQITVTGGLSNPSGIAVDFQGNILVADTGNNRIALIPVLGTGYGTPITVGSGLSGPLGIAVDAAKSIFVADTGNNRIMKIVWTATGYGTPQVLFRGEVGPAGLAVDKNSNLYIADTGNNRIIEEPWSAGAHRYDNPTTVTSGIASPVSVIPDWNGNIFVADVRNNRVVEIQAGSSQLGSLKVNTTGVAQTYNFQVNAGTTIGAVGVLMQGVAGRDFADAGTSTCVVGTYLSATLCGISVAFTPTGSGVRFGAAVLYDAVGNPLATAFLSGTGLAPRAIVAPGSQSFVGAQLSGPSGLAVGPSGNLYIADTGNNRVVELAWGDGSYGAQTILPITGLNTPLGLAIDGGGNLYIASSGNDRVIKLPWTGSGYGHQTRVGTGLYVPSAVTVDRVGNVYVANTFNNQLEVVPWTGKGYGPERPIGNYVKFPQSVAVDKDGSVYIVMPYMNAVIKVPWLVNKYIPQVNLPIPGLYLPSAVVVDGNSNIYVLDGGNNRVVMLPWNGTGYGASLTIAVGFNSPQALAIDGNGDLFVADTGNDRVVKISLSIPPALTFSDTFLGSTSIDSPRVMQVFNVGNESLSMTSLNYAKNFIEAQGRVKACTETLAMAQGNGCEVAISFTPLVVGSPLNETVRFEDNSSLPTGVVRTVSVSGNGLGKLPQTIIFPQFQNVVYGVAPLPMNVTSTSGLNVAVTVLSGPAMLSGSGKLLSILGIGNVVLQATQAGSSKYEAAVAVTRSFNVSRATLTVRPVSSSAIYGGIPPAFQYAISGFVPGDYASQVVSGTPILTSQAGSKPAVGAYPILVVQGSLSARNYTFAFDTAPLTIGKAILTVKAVSYTAVYGKAIPALSATISGFMNGETMRVISGKPSLSMIPGVLLPVGSYAIVPTLGSLQAVNYAFTFVSGTLNITPATLRVTAPKRRSAYGVILPPRSYTSAGFAHRDTPASAAKRSLVAE